MGRGTGTAPHRLRRRASAEREGASVVRRAAHRALLDANLIEPLERRLLLNTDPLDLGPHDLDHIKTGLQTYLQRAETALLPRLTQNIPIIGNRLKDGINFLDDIRNVLTGLPTLPGDAKAQDLINQLAPAFASWNDGAVTITATTNFSSTNPNPATKVDFEFQLAKDLGVRAADGGPIDFDLGLPNLKLDATTNIDLHVQFLLKFKITIDKADAAGPYIDTTPTFGAAQTPEMSFNVTATFPGTEVAAKLGILSIKLKDGGGSELKFGFEADITDPDNKLHVGATSPETPGVTAKMKSDSRAHLDVDARFGFAEGDAFPEILWGVDVNWGFGGATLNNAGPVNSFGSVPTVEFNEVELGLGSYITNFIQPIFDKIAVVLDPVRDVIKLMETRVPVFSDIGPLASIFDDPPNGDGDGDVQFVEIIQKLTDADLGLVRAAAKFYDVLDLIPDGIDPNTRDRPRRVHARRQRRRRRSAQRCRRSSR